MKIFIFIFLSIFIKYLNTLTCPIPLGMSESFAVFAYSSITNVGASTDVFGDVGIKIIKKRC